MRTHEVSTWLPIQSKFFLSFFHFPSLSFSFTLFPWRFSRVLEKTETQIPTTETKTFIYSLFLSLVSLHKTFYHWCLHKKKIKRAPKLFNMQRGKRTIKISFIIHLSRTPEGEHEVSKSAKDLAARLSRCLVISRVSFFFRYIHFLSHTLLPCQPDLFIRFMISRLFTQYLDITEVLWYEMKPL